MNLRDHHKIVTIKKNTEIKEILSSGKKIQTKYGIFFLGHKKTDNQINFAVLIKKSVGKAVWRNYCKRIIRAYVRNKSYKFPEGRQVIFLYTYNGKINYKHLEDEFNKKLVSL
jgi:ribonuclease P protein component